MEPGSPEGSAYEFLPQFTHLDVVLASDETLFRLIALLHRKHVSIGELFWLPRDRRAGHPGGRLKLAIASSPATTDHVITLMRNVIGVIRVHIDHAASGCLPSVSPRPQQIPPTRYVAWSQPIGQASAPPR